MATVVGVTVSEKTTYSSKRPNELVRGNRTHTQNSDPDSLTQVKRIQSRSYCKNTTARPTAMDIEETMYTNDADADTSDTEHHMDPPANQFIALIKLVAFKLQERTATQQLRRTGEPTRPECWFNCQGAVESESTSAWIGIEETINKRTQQLMNHKIPSPALSLADGSYAVRAATKSMSKSIVGPPATTPSKRNLDRKTRFIAYFKGPTKQMLGKSLAK
ncbi:hypothetical protein DFH05DRAFT_1463018 [Lentinula detonsa]|uniref:Uncharacterized protein n=1 Tax=Lentinula detonsa TaxID=2804962 RepID=A0A9W8NTE9_9AGAR|nr:hypothetical protein DFH05DRAFT_1463018 [Lentinula detonsa]